MKSLKKVSFVVVATFLFMVTLSSCHRETCPTYGGENVVEAVEHNC